MHYAFIYTSVIIVHLIFFFAKNVLFNYLKF